MHGLIQLILIHLIYLSISSDVTKASNTSDIHWLVLHYHKTGHDLTRAIFEVLSKELGVTYSDNEGPRRTLWKLEEYSGKSATVPYFKSNINIQGGAEMHFNWNEEIKINYKILHFVRDPFDYIISAYLYHSQAPPPPEHFVRNRRYNPCVYSEKTLTLYQKEMGLFGENETFISDSITSIITLCNELHKQGPLHKELQRLSKESENGIKALQLEACRSIIADEINGGGDLYRMVTNSLRARQAGGNRVKKIYLKEFSTKNESIWKTTMELVLHFLYKNEERRNRRNLLSSNHSFNISDLVEISFRNAFPKKILENNMPNSGVHVTSHLISSEKRALCIKLLENDLVLGPILKTFQRIISDS